MVTELGQYRGNVALVYGEKQRHSVIFVGLRVGKGMASNTLASITTSSVRAAVAVSTHFRSNASAGVGHHSGCLAHLHQLANGRVLPLGVGRSLQNDGSCLNAPFTQRRRKAGLERLGLQRLNALLPNLEALADTLRECSLRERTRRRVTTLVQA